MKLFGSVDVFVEGAHRDVRIGRVAANTGFLEALIRHGDFDEYHLFCPSRSAERALRPALSDLVGPEAARRVTLLHALELPERLAENAYAAFHVGGWSRYHPRLAWLRSAPGIRPFPISGVMQETFGISVVEAMAAGLPVVASDWDGYRDLDVDGETGFLVPTTWARPPSALTRLRGILEARVAQLAAAQAVAVDAAALEDRLSRLADDAALQREMGEAGRRRALERFPWKVVIGQYLALFRELEEAARQFHPPPGDDPDIVDLFDAFGHYPTRPLSSEDLVSLTPAGREVISGRARPPPVYEDLASLLDGELATGTLRALAAGPRAVSDLAPLAGEAAQAGALEYALLWLLKHGLAALER